MKWNWREPQLASIIIANLLFPMIDGLLFVVVIAAAVTGGAVVLTIVPSIIRFEWAALTCSLSHWQTPFFFMSFLALTSSRFYFEWYAENPFVMVWFEWKVFSIQRNSNWITKQSTFQRWIFEYKIVILSIAFSNIEKWPSLAGQRGYILGRHIEKM